MEKCIPMGSQSVVFYTRLEMIQVIVMPGKGDVGHIYTHKVSLVLPCPGHSKGDPLVKVHEIVPQ